MLTTISSESKSPPALKWSRDGKCCFDPERHTYWIGDRNLKGVTSYISTLKEPFDSDAVAEKFAAKNGLCKESILKKWDLDGKVSAAMGSAVHKVFEDYITSGVTRRVADYPKELVAHKFINEYFLTGKLVPVSAEEVVCKGGLASQIDCTAKDKEGNLYILDWKTNGEIKRNNYGKFLAAPFTSVPDCHFGHYSLQLALYREMHPDRVKGAYIVHIGETGYEFIVPMHIRIPNEIFL